MKRVYQKIIEEHLAQDQQMLFLAGPRQVGKTTISRSIETLGSEFHYLNWDVQEHRQRILRGAQTLGETLDLERPRKNLPMIVFDEIHKYTAWKNYLKGFYDLFSKSCHIIVTGSARLDIYQSGGDSLMGRYFLYHVHPLTIGEIARAQIGTTEISPPKKIADDAFQALWTYSGFPAPFCKANKPFYTRWKMLRQKQLFREDIRDLTQIHEVSLLEVLAELLQHQTGQLLNRNNLANKVKVSVGTINRWIDTLKRVYFCFAITPWHQNITRSLIKEPKIYLWDWSLIGDPGAKAENFVACHLLKAVHLWGDLGLGDYKLHFIRDKDKNEVDFLVTRDEMPWFLVEVKLSHNGPISPQLIKFQKQLSAPHAFQVVINLPYEDIDCFHYSRPIVVPAKTLLSQLV